MSTETQTEFLASGGALSQNDRLINRLARAGDEWVSLPELVEAGCGYAIATRASQCRAKGVNIENRTVRDEKTGQRHSFYRIAPSQAGMEGVA